MSRDEERPDERVQRERQSYEKGINRARYDAMLSHSGAFEAERIAKLRDDALSVVDGKIVLELGASAWHSWIEFSETTPAQIHCINISERELQEGIRWTRRARSMPSFALMDANRLGFRDGVFDAVIGMAILHHLEFEKALSEIRRVLKTKGMILFLEPLGMNPVANMVRLFTPSSRTVDETPLRSKHLAQLADAFECTFYFSQFCSVPLGLVSRVLFDHADNVLMRFAHRIDRRIDEVAPPLRSWYRHVLIVGYRR